MAYLLTKRTRFEWLADTIREKGLKRVAEIGYGVGETAKYLLKEVGEITSYVIVDRRDVSLGGRQTNRKKVEIVKGDSAESAGKFRNKSFDLVFIDAAHDYDSVIRDIKAWESKVKDGGVLCGHDYMNSAHRDVAKAVDEMFGDKVKHYEDAYVWWVEV